MTQETKVELVSDPRPVRLLKPRHPRCWPRLWNQKVSPALLVQPHLRSDPMRGDLYYDGYW